MKKYLIVLSIFLLTAIAAYPQRGGGGDGSRGRQGQARQQGQSQGGMQTGRSQTDRRQNRINSQQRKQIGECSGIAEGIRKQARTMAQTSGDKFNAGEARRQRDRIQERIQLMNKEHVRLMQGLDAGQQQAFQEQIRDMNRSRSQVKTQLQQMNSDLEPANPNPQKVKKRAQEMERTMAEFRKQYNTLATQSD